MAKEWAKSFYNSKAWRSVRAYVLRRDLYTCTMCTDRASEVHHKEELTAENITDPMALNPDNLTSLCSRCHKLITKGYEGDVQDGYCFDDDGNVIKA